MRLDRLAERGISIHALREEGDFTTDTAAVAFIKFLSTPSARRATSGVAQYNFDTKISIHALREEGDSIYKTNADLQTIFLSTPSARRATTTLNYPRIIRKFLSTPSARRATKSIRQR